MVIHVFQGSLILRQEKRTSSLYFRFENNTLNHVKHSIELKKQNKKQKKDQIVQQILPKKKKEKKRPIFHINHKYQLVNIK